jgi:hypothetical protein
MGPKPQPRVDGKAVAAFVLGILSIFCLAGPFFGVPAIALGLVSRKDMERSGGFLGGGGLAVGGIVTGAMGTLGGVLGLGLMAVAVLSGLRSEPTFSPPTAFTTTPTAVSPVGGRSPTALELSPKAGKLQDQLTTQVRDAAKGGETVVLETSASWCRACTEVDANLGDPRMQAALTNVVLVRVDIDRFGGELKSLRMWEGSVPWFYLLDSAAHPADAISAGEWDDNVPENMAPVLDAFVHGTLTRRREASHLGAAL